MAQCWREADQHCPVTNQKALARVRDLAVTVRKRHPNPNLAKKHRNYTVEDVADMFGVHKNTVRAWIKDGLPIISDKRPFLILGGALSEYLRNKRVRHKQTCATGEMYCFKCRTPRTPVEGLIEIQPINAKMANRKGICPVCSTIMNRRIGLAKLSQDQKMECKKTLGQEHIVDTHSPSDNSYFKDKVTA